MWSLTELRARNRSSSTLQQALRAVMVLNLVLDRLGVNLDSRFDQGRLVDLGEVEEITRQCRLSLQDLAGEELPQPRPVDAKVVSLEKARMLRGLTIFDGLFSTLFEVHFPFQFPHAVGESGKRNWELEGWS